VCWIYELVAIEATGGFETVVAAGLASACLPVVVVIRRKCVPSRWLLAKRAKTDPIDAAVIAHFAEATKPPLRQLPDEMTRRLADLVARKRQTSKSLRVCSSMPLAASSTITALSTACESAATSV
jgi:transposase